MTQATLITPRHMTHFVPKRPTRRQKIRLWACPCCGQAADRATPGRRAGQLYPPHCDLCDMEYVAKRTWPRVRSCKHQRAIRQTDDFKKKYWHVPRTAGMRKLVKTPDLRWAWDELRFGYGSKTVGPRFLLLAQDFIDILFDYANDTETEAGNVIRFTRILGRDGRVQKVANTLPSPEVRYRKDPNKLNKGATWLYGEVTDTGETENLIYLDPEMSPNGLRVGLIRVALEALDYMAGIPTEYWSYRWKVMQALFPAFIVRAPLMTGWEESNASSPKPTEPCSCGANSPGWYKPLDRWICTACGRLLKKVKAG